MSENSINTPRVDRAFVNPATGSLSEYGYMVLARVIERVGGPVGEILNGRELAAAIEEMRLQPIAPDASPFVDELRQEVRSAPPVVIPEPPQPLGLEAAIEELRGLIQQLDARLTAREIGTL